MVRTVSMQFKETILGRRERNRTGHQVLFSFNCQSRIGRRRQFSDRLMLKKLFGYQTKTCLIGSGNNLNTQYRISAQLKEIVVNPYLIDVENLGPDTGQQL